MQPFTLRVLTICMEKSWPKVELKCLHRPPEGFYTRFVEDWLSGSDGPESVFPRKHFSVEHLKNSYGFYDKARRDELCEVLLRQCKQVGMLPSATLNNIKLLGDENTFCITTGQQLHIFLGPQLILYKIWSVIRQARRLSQKHPNYRFVPVFWMAGEDHDLDEIDHVKLFQNNYRWNLEERKGGSAGRLATAGLGELVSSMRHNHHLAEGGLLDVFDHFYKSSQNFADATQALLLHFFGDEGLVVVNPDDAVLKRHLAELVRKDLEGDALNEALLKGSDRLKKAGYKPAIGNRSTQLFLFEEGKRMRLDRNGDDFLLMPENREVSQESLLKRLENNPEDFSPNALMRPLYQQLILPNAGYVCGPAELFYWHQLLNAFTEFEIPVPLLFLRDSFCFSDKASAGYIEKLNMEDFELWEGYETAANRLRNKLFENLNLEQKILNIENAFEVLLESLHKAGSSDLKALRKTSKSLLLSLNEELKAVNAGIQQKGQYAHLFQRLEKLSSQIFNRENAQERVQCVITYYLKLGNLLYPQGYTNREEEHLFGRLSEL